MSVDFPAAYPTRSVSTDKPVDLQTLQATFAAVLRSYGAAKGGTPTETMLEVLQTSSENAADIRKQERQELQQHTDRQDGVQIDRKLQNQSEIRQSEMSTDYQNQRDRRDTLQNEYQEQFQQSEQQQTVIQSADAPSAVSEKPLLEIERHIGLPISHHESALQKNDSVHSAPSAPPHSSPLADSTRPSINTSANAAAEALPTTMNLPAPLPSAASPSVPPPQAFTIFTALRRFGQSQKTGDEKDDDQTEERADDNPNKKTQPFAFFEAIQTGTARSASHRLKREASYQAENRQTTAPIREKHKESESHRFSSIKTFEEVLNTSPNTALMNREETQKTDQMQYFRRIAAACEAAAQYAPIRIKINLDQLGTLTLRFFYQSDKLMLQFETPSQRSARFLHEQLEDLKAFLSKRNVQLESLKIVIGKSEP